MERDRIPPPTQAAAALWKVGESIIGVHKLGRCCTVRGTEYPLPPRQHLHFGCEG